MLDSLMLSASQRDSLEEATARYETGVDHLASYLSGRGIDRDAARIARLGLASDPIPGHERFQGWMSIPYITPAGVVAMKFRDLSPNPHHKYDGPSGQTIRLYNAMAFHDMSSDVIAICEGELDALVCHQAVGVPAVGTWGTNWLEHYPRCFADYEQVLIVADNDVRDDDSSPGLKHAKKVQATIPNSRIVLPPSGMDLGEWFLAEGRDAIREKMGL